MLAEQREESNALRLWDERKGCEDSYRFTSIERAKLQHDIELRDLYGVNSPTGTSTLKKEAEAQPGFNPLDFDPWNGIFPQDSTERRISMADSTLTKEIESFFRQYNDTFKTIDGRRIATLYHAPCLTLRGDGTFLLLDTRESIETFFQKVADTYKGEGYVDSAFKNLTVVPIGGRSALATVDWTMLRKDGTPIRSWRQSYNLLRTTDGWKIILSTFHVAQGKV